ncbi:MAG: dipeptidyl aminopeptidase, partial [Actinobacteria bacterium]|nr:dipeptidyl aminopeptidase [Actinomycetota bacterium]
MMSHRFFTDEGFEFLALIALGSAAYRLSEVGEVYATADRITDGDGESWFEEWMATATRVRRIAEDCESRGDVVSARDALIILNNGSDGPVSDMLFMGAVDAVARGWNAITFDGPGQGYALYEQGMFFRYDWEKVITPVVDFLVARHDVDPERIVLSGNSQGGYWVPRAVAFEKRIAAAVADPGVVRVDTSWRSHLPPVMIQLLESGDDADFDSYFAQGVENDPVAQTTLAKRKEPYGSDSMAAIMHELEKWDLADVAGQITCPILITEPEDEQFWPGQSRQL